MKVDDSKTLVIDSEHSIEMGGASWDNSELAIRRRKDLNGRFDVHSSSEISINGHVNITDLFMYCLDNNLINAVAMTKVFNGIIDSSKKQNVSITIC